MDLDDDRNPRLEEKADAVGEAIEVHEAIAHEWLQAEDQFEVLVPGHAQAFEAQQCQVEGTELVREHRMRWLSRDGAVRLAHVQFSHNAA